MISKDQLRQLLLEQREAILRKPYGIERIVLKSIGRKILLPHVIVITGLRRSGKSTLLRQLMKLYYDDKDFYYINFEDERLFDFQAKDFNIIYELLVELFGDKKTFFIDEIQNVHHFENFVRRFYDEGFKFLITGSSARLLNEEIGTKLTGRHVNIVVKPFSFEEYLMSQNFKFDRKHLFRTHTRIELKKYFKNYLLSGGMPEYIIYGDPEVLTRVYEDIVIKDVISRYKIENQKQLKELYQYLITNMSQKFSYNSLRKFIDINSANTIKKYIGYLEETYFINVVNKFDYSLKKQIINDKKVYVIDNGFIQKVSIKFTNDNGWLLENLVFAILKNKGDVFYYSGKHECDFIVAENNEVLEAIQVSWDLTTANKDREIAGLLEAMDKFKLKKGLILTNDQDEEVNIDNKKVIVKPVWKWLLE